MTVVVLGVGAAITFAAGWQLLQARDNLTEVRVAAREATDALEDGRVQAATDSLNDAHRLAADAEAGLRHPFVQPLTVVPIVGRNITAVTAMAEAAGQLADGGRLISAELASLPDGLATFAPQDGAIPVGTVQDLAPHLRHARARVRAADETLTRAPATLLLEPVATARSAAVIETDQLLNTIEAATALANHLPGFLGASEPRRYFFGAQNPAELRGTGGFIGAYTTVTVDQGRLSFDEFQTVTELDTVPISDIEPPSPSFAARYDRYGGAGFMQNINMTPDFPSAAAAIRRLYETQTGETLDGVIVADPFALAALLRVAGPADVPAIGQVDADQIVEVFSNEAYEHMRDSDARKRVLGDIAAAVLERFLDSPPSEDPMAGLTTLADAVAPGHVLLHSAHSHEQAAFDAAGISGRLGTDSGDFLAVVVNNAAGNKADYFLSRQVSYDVELHEDGVAEGTARIALDNGAPTEGEPAPVIGPHRDGFEPGENLSLLSVYCPSACALHEFQRAGMPAAVSPEKELGQQVYSSRVALPSGAATELTHRWTVGDAWEGDTTSGRYRLTFQNQATVQPAPLAVMVTVPEGMEVTAVSPGATVDGDQVTWTGEAADLGTLSVHFQRPVIPALMDRITAIWNRSITLR